MASLTFFYSSMNAGKTLELIKTFYNFAKTDATGHVISDNVICLTSSKDNRHGVGYITSRALTSKLEAFAISQSDDLYEFIKTVIAQRSKVDLILVDEAQFFTREHILALCKVVDELNINVMCYGLRTTFKGQSFEGSQALLELADKLREVKNRCYCCDSKATMTIRHDSHGNVISEGESIHIASDTHYTSACRKHFMQAQQHLSIILD